MKCIEIQLIAPCGMNCGICAGYLREKNKCPGCREDEAIKRVSCAHCTIKNCDNLALNNSKFCYECSVFPCRRLKALDKRYRSKYKMSMLENLENIQILGLKTFAANETERWRCTTCGGFICVHKGYCLHCGPARP